MKRVVITCSIYISIFFVFSFDAIAADVIHQTDYRAISASSQYKSGILAYRRTCSYCHDHQGVAPAIVGRKLPVSQIKAFVRLGVGAMPAFRVTEISDEQLEQLATWIASQASPP